MVAFLSHLHPLLVHLPIGILLMACLFQWLMRKDSHAALRPATGLALLLGSFSALFSCITGYLLSLDGDYDSDLVNQHLVSALVTTVAGFGMLYIYYRKPVRIYLNVSALVLFFLVIITGHLGGSLTHGSDYLTGAFSGSGVSAFKREPIPDPQEAMVYTGIIDPLFREKCIQCHGPDKQKGKLRLDRPEFILKGGKDGQVLKAGDPDKSELVKRILLPRNDDDHMPPREKPQLSKDDIELLHWWVENGLPMEKKAREVPQNEKVNKALLSLQGPGSENTAGGILPENDVEPAPQRAIDTLKIRGVMVLPVSENSNYLTVNFVSADSFALADWSLLLPLKKQLLWLKVSGRTLTDSALSIISQCDNLYRLHIDQTGTTDSGLSSLAKLKNLRLINLTGNPVTVKGIRQLSGLKELRSIYVFHTSVGTGDWEALRKSFPDAVIDTGNYMVPMLGSDTTVVKAPKK